MFGETKIQSTAGRYLRMERLLRVRAASCFAFLYLVLSILTTLHRHSPVFSLETGNVTCAGHTALSPYSTGLDADSEIQNTRRPSALPTIAPPDCPLCDFLAEPVSVTSLPTALLLPIEMADNPAPPIQAVAYKPFRFHNRSASRAPPVASSLA